MVGAFTAQSMYGAAPPQTPSYSSTASALYGMSTDDVHTGWRGLFDLNNPLTWFGGILLVTLGAASVSGSVRLARTEIKGGIGRSGNAAGD
jgi:hypothetical protein